MRSSADTGGRNIRRFFLFLSALEKCILPLDRGYALKVSLLFPRVFLEVPSFFSLHIVFDSTEYYILHLRKNPTIRCLSAVMQQFSLQPSIVNIIIIHNIVNVLDGLNPIWLCQPQIIKPIRETSL